MNRKYLIITTVVLFSGIVAFYFYFIFGKLEFRRNRDTPKEFLNHTIAKKYLYGQDSTQILNQMRSLVKKHDGFFYSKEFDDSTQLMLDTILYSPDFNKISGFIVTKNPTSKQLAPDEKSAWYYDASCYLGVRHDDSLYLSWFGPSFTNSINQDDLIKKINEYYFRLYATQKNAKGRDKYNLNDVRFWTSAVWKEIEEKIKEKKKFE